MGFVGRHMLKRLIQSGHETWGVDLDQRGAFAGGTPRYQSMVGDCRWWFSSADAHFDVVIHLAANIGGRAMIDGSPMAVAENIALDAEMFQWAKRTHVGHVIYFSSSAAYPTWLQHKSPFPHYLKESDIDFTNDVLGVPDSTYGWAKLTGEYQAYVSRETLEMPITVFRPFSGYGEDQSLDYPFPSFIDRAVKREDPFTIWGDGTAIRDWIHISDIAAMVMFAIDERITGTFNLGSGRATTFTDLATIICSAAGYEPEWAFHPDAPQGVHTRVADITHMDSVFGMPSVSLEMGVERALENRIHHGGLRQS